MRSPETAPETSYSEDLRYWLALRHAPGVGNTTFRQLLESVDSPRDLFVPASGDMPDLPAKLRHYLKKPDWQQVDAELQWAEDNQCCILTLQDPRYPHLLKQIPDPPPILFVRGQTDCLQHPQVAMVGSRNPSGSGRQIAYEFARQLTQSGLTITSGLALGIDAASHEGALAGGGSTIAVAGTGLDRIYPARHRDLALQILENGAIISEFSPGTPALAGNFPRRNRIISGLSLGTLVVEAAVKSGSLITARLAAEQGREVFAIPGSIHNPLARGCHELVKLGAKLTETTTDILEELGYQAMQHFSALPVEFSGSAGDPTNQDPTLLSVIEKMGYEPISIDTLVARCGLTADVVSSMLLTLELQGCITSTGGLYSRIN